jgi:hypothetical protein
MAFIEPTVRIEILIVVFNPWATYDLPTHTTVGTLVPRKIHWILAVGTLAHMRTLIPRKDSWQTKHLWLVVLHYKMPSCGRGNKWTLQDNPTGGRESNKLLSPPPQKKPQIECVSSHLRPRARAAFPALKIVNICRRKAWRL